MFEEKWQCTAVVKKKDVVERCRLYFVLSVLNVKDKHFTVG